MIPPQARDIFLYYGAVIVIGVLIFLRRGRGRKGMRLRFRGNSPPPPPSQIPENENNVINFKQPPLEGFTHIEPPGERPLNVVFNFNGHSWDAYEVLGLPAGSAIEKVEIAYRESLLKMDPGSHPFLEAAYRAIQTQWKMYRAAGN